MEKYGRARQATADNVTRNMGCARWITIWRLTATIWVVPHT